MSLYCKGSVQKLASKLCGWCFVCTLYIHVCAVVGGGYIVNALNAEAKKSFFFSFSLKRFKTAAFCREGNNEVHAQIDHVHK